MIPLPYRVLAFAVALVAAYWIGRFHGATAVRAEVESVRLELEARVSKAEAKSATESIKVVTEYVDRVQTVERHVPVVRDRLVRVCNEAGGGRVVPGGTGNPDAATGTDASHRSVDGFAQDLIACRETAERLRALQKWKSAHGG